VRTVAAEVADQPAHGHEGYQQLRRRGLVEKRRGLGMFINAGARALLLAAERRSSWRTSGRGARDDQRLGSRRRSCSARAGRPDTEEER
jgi:hypothetical protein